MSEVPSEETPELLNQESLKSEPDEQTTIEDSEPDDQPT